MVPLSHEYLGATASDLDSVGECENLRALNEHWCQDGKVQLEQKARVAWKVVLYCSNRASICSHALILLSRTRWIVMTGWCTSISLQTFDQTRLDCGSLLCTSISLHRVFQKRLDCGSLSAYTHQSPALCSNTFDYGGLFVYPPART